MTVATLAPPSPPPAQSREVDHLLAWAVQAEASDLHLVVGTPPSCRIHGRLHADPGGPLTEAELLAALRQLCPPEIAENLTTTRDVDFSVQRTIAGHARRFRVNVFRAQRRLGSAIRIILNEIPTLEWSGFPRPVAEKLASYRNGLVLFTGITGSGKSTSLAMLIALINAAGGRRVLTIEEPIEYVHTPACDTVISQREVGTDTASFADGLKFGLRQDPDVILVGEIRDRETAQMALSAAETGHLVFSTIHTRDAKGAITRIADMFPQEAQPNIRTQLAMSLRAVVSQHLLPASRAEQRRALAMELLYNTLPVASAIRAGRIESIDDAILTGRTDGMVALDDSLRVLVAAGDVTKETARRFANDPKRFA